MFSSFKIAQHPEQTMPKKTNEPGQRRRTGADKRRRTYELYGKCKPTRQGDELKTAQKSSKKGPISSQKKSKKSRL